MSPECSCNEEATVAHAIPTAFLLIMGFILGLVTNVLLRLVERLR